MFPNIHALKEKTSRTSREAGFTLPEIATALLVFGILCAIAIPIFLSQRQSVASASLETLLLSASNSVETEKEANNGLYPIYTPTDFKETTELNDFKYYYSKDQKGYCVEGTKNGQTLYIGTATGGKVSTESCIGDYEPGGDEPSDGGDKPAPPSQSSPKIAALSPSSQVGRSAGQVITITGSNFVVGATVLFGNQSIPAIVANAGSLTFKSPGYGSYSKVPVQVINPTKRSSNIAEFEFINPIIGTKADTPTPITVTNITSNNATVKATAITCPFNASPRYAFKVTQRGNTTNPDGIAFKDITGRDVTAWSAINSFTYTNTSQGLQYTMEARAICELETVFGTASDWTAPKQWAHTIDKPVAPTTAPIVPDPSIVIINTNYVIKLPVYTSCPTGTTVKEYRLYQNGSIYGTPGLATSYTIAAGSVDTTRVYKYSAVCETPWAVSPEGSTSVDSTMVRITSKPDTPAAPTGLGTSVGYTQSTAYWAPVACNFGTAYYRFVWTGNASGETAWSPATNATVGHAQGQYYTWRVDAKCIYNTFESGIASSVSTGFTSPVQTPGAPYNFGNDGWGTWWWTNPVCPAGTTVQIYAYQTRHGSDYGTWVEQNWNNDVTRSGLGWYNEGLPFDNYARARCIGPSGTVSNASGDAYHGWTAYLNHWGVGADLVAWRTTRIHTTSCPPYAWGVSPSMATWIQGGARAAGWDGIWGDHTNATFGGASWGSGWITGYSYCTTSWRGSGQAGATGGW